MEPGFRDREYRVPNAICRSGRRRLQWSPVLETGNTTPAECIRLAQKQLQWSPVLETGNTRLPSNLRARTYRLQWSPVLETGNTSPGCQASRTETLAAMEPGFRDREYAILIISTCPLDKRCNGARF